MTGRLHVRRTDRLLEATLARPPVNALNGSLYRQLRTTFERARSGEVLVLAGEGRYFSAGQDVKELGPQLAPDQARHLIQEGSAAVAAALRCEAPLVVAVQGAAVGAGALLACAADVVVLADDSWLCLPELRVGTTMGYSVASRLLPGALVRRMLLTGERVQVKDLGRDLGARVVPADQVRGTALEIADELLRLPAGLQVLARSTWGANERERTAVAYEDEVRGLLATW